ncbi:hypothetical protein BC827DRAFT_1264226 [Russula dissimulans]|nr:hypothetical protein BC827DRAFT_1264226 [Russula dissimulans]
MDSDELSQHLIYHPSSPGFDIPDYLPLRRVKPLPKRKRSSPDPARPLPLNTMLPPILPPPPGPDATAAELIAHAEVLSAQIAFQPYFLGGGGGVADYFASATTASTPTNSTTTRRGGEMPPTVEQHQQQQQLQSQLLPLPPADADVVTPSPGDGREGDHLDHTQQQGNAKKRKVPAHLSGSQMGPDSADVHSSEEELQLPQRQHSLSGDRAPPGFASSPGVVASAGAGAGGASGGARLALRTRRWMVVAGRRQLAALLGSPSPTAPGDSHSLALDQALLANNHALLYKNRSGVSSSSRNARLVKSRLIRRRASRAVRRYRTLPPLARSEPTRRIFPDGEFTFLSSNAASERLIATRAEYTVLCDRFEHELARQAEKATESLKAGAPGGIGAGGSDATVAKRNDRAVRKARGTTQIMQDADVPAVSKTASPTKTSGKKKKRSALANASNPHHLRNYVPSRIPNQGHLSAAQLGTNAQSMLSPLPLLFLSAQIPPRRGGQQRPSLAVASQLANPAEEWICPTCEYRLFYGNEQGYRLGLRNRKKILKRRRRARERAAAAANGSGTGAGIHGKGSGFDDEEDLDIERTGSGLALSQTGLASVEVERREKDGGVEVGAAG